MRPAEGQAHDIALGQCLVSGVAVDLQDSDEALKMPQWLLGFAVGRIEIGDAGRIDPAPGSIVPCIGEQLAGLGAAAAGIKHRRRGLVGEELAGRLQPLEQPLMDRPKQEGCLSNPVGEGRAVQIDALARVDLGLAVEGKVIGIFADQHMRHRRLGRDAALDEARRSRRLHHDLLASPAGVFRPARDDDAELGRHDVEALGTILAHHVQHSFAARATLVLDVYDLLDTRQMRGQRTAVGAALLGARLALGSIGDVLRREAFGLDLFGLFQTQQQLLDGQALCPAAEAVALKLLDDLAQPLVLGPLSVKHRLKRGQIVARRVGWIAHEADSIMHSNALPASSAACGINLPRPARASRGRHARAASPTPPRAPATALPSV